MLKLRKENNIDFDLVISCVTFYFWRIINMYELGGTHGMTKRFGGTHAQKYSKPLIKTIVLDFA